MAISNSAYHALEDIVGPEYISREPVDLDSYWHLKNLLLYNAADPDELEKEFL